MAPPIVHDVLRSPGRPLEPSVRGEMEARFGHDFSRVRVHADARAAASAEAVSAQAYTGRASRRVRRRRLPPGDGRGTAPRRHELTHVVQQGGGDHAGQLAGGACRRRRWRQRASPRPAPEPASRRRASQRKVVVNPPAAAEHRSSHTCTRSTGGVLSHSAAGELIDRGCKSVVLQADRRTTAPAARSTTPHACTRSTSRNRPPASKPTEASRDGTTRCPCRRRPSAPTTTALVTEPELNFPDTASERRVRLVRLQGQAEVGAALAHPRPRALRARVADAVLRRRHRRPFRARLDNRHRERHRDQLKGEADARQVHRAPDRASRSSTRRATPRSSSSSRTACTTRCREEPRRHRPYAGAADRPRRAAFGRAGRWSRPSAGRSEARFGHDFSSVRVHTDGRAAESARAVSANAYTVGSDVVFGAGRYAPATTEGSRLLAHELAHTVQQRGATAESPPIAPGSGLEHRRLGGRPRGVERARSRRTRWARPGLALARERGRGASGSPSRKPRSSSPRGRSTRTTRLEEAALLKVAEERAGSEVPAGRLHRRATIYGEYEADEGAHRRTSWPRRRIPRPFKVRFKEARRGAEKRPVPRPHDPRVAPTSPSGATG